MWADASHAESDRFGALSDSHVPHLYDYCRSLVVDRQNAARATQATLVIAHSLLDRLHDTGRLRTWLLALARLECRSAVYTWALPPQPSAGGSEPDTEEFGRRQIEGQGHAAVAMLNALPAEEREVLDLVYRHYLSSADVAAVIGVSADRASALLSGALSAFERAQQVGAEHNPGAAHAAHRTATADALVGGVRVISTIPLTVPPPSMLAGAARLALDPAFASYRAALMSTVGDLGPDGFPAPPDQGNEAPRTELLRDRARRYSAGLRSAIPMSRARFAVLGGLVLVLAAGLAVLASSSSGSPKAHDAGHSLGDEPVGPSSASTRHSAPRLPITALLPKKQDQGIVLPMLPAGTPSRAPSGRPNPKPSATHTSPPTTSPSPSPSPASPSPTPTSPSPSPTSPSPTPVSPSPTATPTA